MIGRKKGLLKRVFAICMISAFCAGTSITAWAAPTDSYTRVDVPGNGTELRLTREMYTAEQVITASTLGLENSLEGITDLYCAQDGTLLLLCGGSSRLIRINPDGTLKDELAVTDGDGNVIDFTGARGIYSDADGVIYLADTQNGRILLLDQQGRLIGTLERPQSALIPENFIYQPVAVSRDTHGYIYILSQGCYYGALLYTPEQEFLGFYGANNVAGTVLDTLSYLWDKLTSNDVKKAASVKKLPYSFVDFDFDAEGYMVTCTGGVGSADAQSNGYGQIRKVSPNGENILYKRNLRRGSTDSGSYNFLEDKVVFEEEIGSKTYRPQTLVSIAVSEDGFLFALDSTNGLIYLYDSECNRMSTFGGGLGTGRQTGVFKTPVALALSGTRIYVADYDNYNITVFEPTDYGMLFREAQSAYLAGDYDDAKSIWEQVLSQDRGNQLACRGLAMVYYNEGDYEGALAMAREAYDYSVYDLAWQAVLTGWIGEHFHWLVLGILVLVGGITTAVLLLRRRRGKLIQNENVQVLLAVPFHPFRSFTDLKWRGKSSWAAAIVLTILFYVGSVLKDTASGFLYSSVSLREYNSLYTLAATVGLLILWSVCNWLVCSMFQGLGSVKEIYTATAYALLPLILFQFIQVGLSNFLPLSAAGIMDGLGTAVTLYTFFLLCVAMINVHDIDFFKFLWTGFLTICMMILVVFVLFMCMILLKQFGSFIYSIYEEVIYR